MSAFLQEQAAIDESTVAATVGLPIPPAVLKGSKPLETVKQAADSGLDRRTATKQYHATAVVSSFAKPSPPASEADVPTRMPRFAKRPSTSLLAKVLSATPSHEGICPIQRTLPPPQVAKEVPSRTTGYSARPPPLSPPAIVLHATLTPSTTSASRNAFSVPTSSEPAPQSSRALARWSVSEASCAISGDGVGGSTALMLSPEQPTAIEAHLTARPRLPKRAASKRWALAPSTSVTVTRKLQQQTALATVAESSVQTAPSAGLPMSRRWRVSKSVALSVPMAVTNTKPAGEACDCVWTSAASMSCTPCAAKSAAAPLPRRLHQSARSHATVPAPHPPATKWDKRSVGGLFSELWQSTTSMTYRPHTADAVGAAVPGLGQVHKALTFSGVTDVAEGARFGCTRTNCAEPSWNYDLYVNATLQLAKEWMGFTLVESNVAGKASASAFAPAATTSTSTTIVATVAPIRPWPWVAVSYASASA